MWRSISGESSSSVGAPGGLDASAQRIPRSAERTLAAVEYELPRDAARATGTDSVRTPARPIIATTNGGGPSSASTRSIAFRLAAKNMPASGGRPVPAARVRLKAR